MGTYIFRRILWLVLLLLIVLAIIFLIFYVLPSGDPAAARAGKQGDANTIREIRDRLGLNNSLPHQFLDYVKALVLHFDFGRSYVNDTQIRPLILDALPNTLMLVIGAAFLWFVSGVVIGTISAVFRGSLLDRFAMGSALLAISAPVYWLGLVGLYLFSSDIGKFNIFPESGAYDASQGIFRHIDALFLPWIVLAMAFAAIYARLLRANLLETLSEDYIRTARAKGLTETRVVLRHGLRSAITPIITVLGLDIGILIGGAILTETVFGIPGIGRLSYNAISRGDLPLIQGTTLFLALAVMLMSLVVDILYAFLDPRVRY